MAKSAHFGIGGELPILAPRQVEAKKRRTFEAVGARDTQVRRRTPER